LVGVCRHLATVVPR